MTEAGMRHSANDHPARDLDAVFADLRRSYNPPPAPPLDAMWARIEQARGPAPDAAVAVPRASEWGRARAWLWMAAALVFGIALGRASALAESQSGERRTPDSLLSIEKAEQSEAFQRRAGEPLAACQLPAADTPRGDVDN